MIDAPRITQSPARHVAMIHVGPESGSDSSTWCTELNRPLTRVAS